MFRRKEKDSAQSMDGHVRQSVLPINSQVISELFDMSKASFTGSVRLRGQDSEILGEVFLFEGRIYAATITRYQPDVLARCVSAGYFSEEEGGSLQLRLNGLASVAPEMVATGLIDVDSLAAVHQELVLASVGALVLVPGASIERRPNQATSSICTLPLALDDLIAMVERRYRRLAQTAAELTRLSQRDDLCGSCEQPGSLVLSVIADLPDSGQEFVRDTIPEVAATLARLDGLRSLDEIAKYCGFTRAEVVHIAQSLMEHDLVTIESCGGDDQNEYEFETANSGENFYWLVPEQCGSRDWSLASANTPIWKGEGLVGNVKNIDAVKYSPSHETDLIVFDSTQSGNVDSVRIDTK
jgi:CRP-like cAMP-binding protein